MGMLLKMHVICSSGLDTNNFIETIDKMHDHDSDNNHIGSEVVVGNDGMTSTTTALMMNGFDAYEHLNEHHQQQQQNSQQY